MTRKYFLDWLRVLAFAVLVLFHTGMLYVTWSYNLKSPRLTPHLEWVMEAISPWRMTVLFVVSGVACAFLVARLGGLAFLRDRLLRLLPVILTGMLLVNPAQVWAQLRAQGDTNLGLVTYWWSSYLVSDRAHYAALGRPTPTWDHLWFLIYLLVYILIFAALLPVVRRMGSWRPRLGALVLAPGLWMAATSIAIALWAPFTHALVNDWGAHLKWGGLFATGAIIAFRPDFWSWAVRRRRALALVALTLLALHLAARLACLAAPETLGPTLAYRTTEGLFGWATVLALFGYSAAHLDRPSRTLSYLNEAVLPIYVLHQPILLTTAWLLFPLGLPLWLEAAVLLTTTGGGSLAAYHLLIRPWAPMRVMFGLKAQARAGRPLAGPA